MACSARPARAAARSPPRRTRTWHPHPPARAPHAPGTLRAAPTCRCDVVEHARQLHAAAVEHRPVALGNRHRQLARQQVGDLVEGARGGSAWAPGGPGFGPHAQARDTGGAPASVARPASGRAGPSSACPARPPQLPRKGPTRSPPPYSYPPAGPAPGLSARPSQLPAPRPPRTRGQCSRGSARCVQPWRCGHFAAVAGGRSGATTSSWNTSAAPSRPPASGMGGGRWSGEGEGGLRSGAPPGWGGRACSPE